MNFMAKPERKQLKNNPREKQSKPNPHTFFMTSPQMVFFHTEYAKLPWDVLLQSYFFVFFVRTECILQFLFFEKEGILYPKMRLRAKKWRYFL